MKKILIWAAVGVVMLVIAVAIGVSLFLDSAVKRGVETVAPRLTKTDVKLDKVSLSLLSGSGSIQGFVLGNPQGYKSSSAIQVGNASLSLSPRSLFSDKVVVRAISVQGPEITFETDLKGNNLSKIIANLNEATGGNQEATSADKSTTRKLQVDEFLVTGGKVHVTVTALGDKSVTVPLPNIEFRQLGQGPDGITAAELTKRVLTEVLHKASQAAAESAGSLGKAAAKDAAGKAASTLEEATKGIGNLLKRK